MKPDDPDKMMNVNFRWTHGHVAVVKRAAALAGVPYTSWLKMVAFRAAIKDIQDGAVVEAYLAGTPDPEDADPEDEDDDS